MNPKTRVPCMRSRIATPDMRRVPPPPKTPEPFYTSQAWVSFITDIRHERGDRCEDSQHNPKYPRVGLRIYGDHIKELRDGGAALDKANIMLRCARCHGKKTAEERAKRMLLQPR